MNLPSTPHPAEALILAKVTPSVLERARRVHADLRRIQEAAPLSAREAGAQLLDGDRLIAAGLEGGD